MKKLFFITLTSLLVLSACKDGNVTEPPGNAADTLKIEDYYPITENVKYIYKGEGNEFASYTVYIDYISNGRVQTRTNNGGTETVRVMELKDGQLTELMSRGETYFRENFTDREFSDGKILLKEPLKEGTSWSAGEGIKSTITGIDKEVVTPQGNHKAIEVTTEGSKGTTVEYYAKDVGLVKSVSKGDGYEVSSTLSDIEKDVTLTQTVTLFHPDIDGINLSTVDVQADFKTNDEAKDVISETIKELSIYELLSTNTKINKLYFDEKKESVHIDLSKDFVSEMNVGAGFEGLVLQSIANTLGTYYGVQNVFLTIDGGPYESGHILLNEDEPLKVDYSNIKAPQ